MCHWTLSLSVAFSSIIWGQVFPVLHSKCKVKTCWNYLYSVWSQTFYYVPLNGLCKCFPVLWMSCLECKVGAMCLILGCEFLNGVLLWIQGSVVALTGSVCKVVKFRLHISEKYAIKHHWIWYNCANVSKETLHMAGSGSSVPAFPKTGIKVSLLFSTFQTDSSETVHSVSRLWKRLNLVPAKDLKPDLEIKK